MSNDAPVQAAKSPALNTGPAKRPRVGFLGVGWIGRHRMEALVKSGSIDAVAVADPSEEMARKAELIVPGIAVVRDLDALLEMPCDGIVIATPSALHAEQARAALVAGKAVFCQKPLGRNASEVREVIAVAREKKSLLGIDLSYRFLTGARMIKTLVEKRAVGDIYAVNAVFHNAYGPDKPWFYDRALSGGGCVIDLGIHLVDLVLWILGFPRVTNICSKLFAAGMPLEKNSRKVEEYAFAHADLGAGTHVSLDCSWRLPAGRNAVIGVSLFGSDGGLSIRNTHGSFYDFITERFHSTSREVLHSSPEDWGSRAAVAWARRLSEGNAFDGECERLIDVAEVLDAIYHQ
jgi:predicted dehydrogenase